MALIFQFSIFFIEYNVIFGGLRDLYVFISVNIMKFLRLEIISQMGKSAISCS